eukprot:GEMP01017238.1.p1 GENE.GEMP01017238.1~~GEMP01017238.1.p1  ORF type:complete len:432 (+),score=96.89 GEMP01017238.1:251-1546(+)
MTGGRESSKIFVAKIPIFVSQQDLHEVFSRYGAIEETKMLFHEDGAFRGCAFIKFFNEEFAHNALELNGSAVFSKENLVVRMAEDKRTNQRKKQEAAEHRQSQQISMKNDMTRIRAQQQQQPVLSLNQDETFPWSYSADRKKDGWWGMSPMEWMETQGYVYGYEQAESVWTEYRNAEGIPYYHNALTGLTQWEKPKQMQPDPPPPTMHRPRANDNGMNLHNGNAAQRQSSVNVSGTADDESRYGPSGCNLFVFHLPDEWMDADLYDGFVPFGNIVSAKVMKETATQRSRGFGFVSYDCQESAMLAIKKMQGYKAGKKRLKVEFKKGEAFDNLSDEYGGSIGDSDAKRPVNDDPKLTGFIRAVTERGMDDMLLYNTTPMRNGPLNSSSNHVATSNSNVNSVRETPADGLDGNEKHDVQECRVDENSTVADEL